MAYARPRLFFERDYCIDYINKRIDVKSAGVMTHIFDFLAEWSIKTYVYGFICLILIRVLYWGFGWEWSTSDWGMPFFWTAIYAFVFNMAYVLTPNNKKIGELQMITESPTQFLALRGRNWKTTKVDVLGQRMVIFHFRNYNRYHMKIHGKAKHDLAKIYYQKHGRMIDRDLIVEFKKDTVGQVELRHKGHCYGYRVI